MIVNYDIDIVVPLYNEENCYKHLIVRLDQLIINSPFLIRVILVDDGSNDMTPILIKETCLKNENYRGIILSRNFGHQTALTAGLANSTATTGVFIIDGDLQDPPELLFDFYNKLAEGYDVVYAVRKKRKESFIKRITYKAFYRLLKNISNINLPLDSGDFCLISTKVVKLLNSMPEESRFLRGMRSWVGFNQYGFEYERQSRDFGDSKYTLKKLINLAFNGIFNFSEFPIKFIFNVGITTVFVSLIYFVYLLYLKLIGTILPQGFVSIIFLISLFGGLNLLAIGILGEYILRIFFQVKKRPHFIIKEILN